MKKARRYFAGDEVDEMEAANKSDEAMSIAQSVGAGAKNTDIPKPAAKSKAAAKPAPKAAPKEAPKEAPKAAPVDVTKLSVAERRKLSRENPSVSGPTDTRSVNQRLRAAFGFSKGGSVGSASKRADGIAQRGKTRGTMC
jgi:hypothetical protein